MLQFLPIKTRVFLPPKDNIYDLLSKLPKLREGDIVFITSKVLAIAQGRTVKIEEKINKDRLIKAEADSYIPRTRVPNKYTILTIKNNTLIASAGIDESNADGYYVLWPNNIQKHLKEIWAFLRSRHGIKKLGVVTTDSHLQPMHRGTIGISIGAYGIEPLKDYRGQPDIFGRKLKVTQTNVIDGLAATAVLLMGEGRENQPLLIVRKAPIVFTNRASYHKLTIPAKEDIYYPLLKAFNHGRSKVSSRRRRKH